jgi:hypothetical protein
MNQPTPGCTISLVKPHVAQAVVCDPWKNALLKVGNKNDRVDARKLSELLRVGLLTPVYHGDSGVRTLRELSRSYLTVTKDLSEDCVVAELGQRVSALSIPGWPLPAQQATVLPIRLHENSEAAGFLVLGIHPGRAFDDTYREFARRLAEQIAIGLASALAYDKERQRAEALAEIDRQNCVLQQCKSRVPNVPCADVGSS